MNRKILIALILLLLSNKLHAQNKFKGIDDFIENQLKNWHIPNVSIAITNRDSILYIKEYGEDKSKGNYLIGSVSKPFTAIAVMQLVEQGKIELDDPVKRYLGWFETNNNKVSEKITVRHLLNQTSGLAKKAGFYSPQSANQTEIESGYRNYLLNLTAEETALGKQHVYCNLNYQLLGQIIQKVSGHKYADYVNANIFTPVGMKNTFATNENAQNFGLKNGYQYLFGYPIKREFPINDNNVAAGDIASNTEDLSKFLQVLLKKGNINGDSLISSETLKQMHTPVSTRYGMGFSIGDWNGLHSIRHSGLTKNYGSAINILPDQNYGIVILSNINSFYAVRNLMDGIIIRLNKQEKVAYTPYELYFRYALLALFLWSFVEFLGRLNNWRKQNFATNYSRSKKIISKLILSLLLAISWLFVIPHFAEIPLFAMVSMQPDLGYALFIGALIGTLSAFVQYVLKSNNEMQKVQSL